MNLTGLAVEVEMDVFLYSLVSGMLIREVILWDDSLEVQISKKQLLKKFDRSYDHWIHLWGALRGSDDRYKRIT